MFLIPSELFLEPGRHWRKFVIFSKTELKQKNMKMWHWLFQQLVMGITGKAYLSSVKRKKLNSNLSICAPRERDTQWNIWGLSEGPSALKPNLWASPAADIWFISHYLESGRGHGNPLQYFCLENPMDRGSWQTIVYRVTKSQTQLCMSTHALWHQT